MNKLFIVFLIPLFLHSCNPKKDTEKFPAFDKNGKLNVYSEEVYTKMWMKNRNLKVNVIDTFCINQTAKAKKDIQNGKLIYFGFHEREFPKMTKILSQFGIETKEHLGRCVRLGGFEPYCYQKEMYKEIDRKYGENFIDSIFKVAQREFIIENPNIEYIVDGIDLRKKILQENSH
ncbi:hypothetical protein [Flavobacterium sp. GCM10027622]|uniref:hypothetical protein n=1 Tax=unclassified Flavobacterium TaxID=196869 RepID=UPI00360944C8